MLTNFVTLDASCISKVELQRTCDLDPASSSPPTPPDTAHLGCTSYKEQSCQGEGIIGELRSHISTERPHRSYQVEDNIKLKQLDAKYVVLACTVLTPWVDNEWTGEVCEEVVTSCLYTTTFFYLV